MEDFNANLNVEDIHEFEIRTIDTSIKDKDKEPKSGIPKSTIIQVISSPTGGKTFLIQFLFYALKHVYPAAVVYCGTEMSQGAFSPVVGGAFVSPSYNEGDHRKNVSRQIMCFKEKCPFKEIISVIDDFGYNKKISKSETIVGAYKNGSQWYHSLQIYGYQSINDIPDDLRNGASFVFVFFEKEDSNRRKIHRAYFKTLIPEYKDFCQLMNDICEKHVALVVDLKKQSSVLSECVFYFKAPFWRWKHSDKPEKERPYPEGWRFGCQQFIEWSDQRYDKNAMPDFLSTI